MTLEQELTEALRECLSHYCPTCGFGDEGCATIHYHNCSMLKLLERAEGQKLKLNMELEAPDCHWCGEPSELLTEVDDSDPSVGYRSVLALCPACQTRRRTGEPLATHTAPGDDDAEDWDNLMADLSAELEAERQDAGLTPEKLLEPISTERRMQLFQLWCKSDPANFIKTLSGSGYDPEWSLEFAKFAEAHHDAP